VGIVRVDWSAKQKKAEQKVCSELQRLQRAGRGPGGAGGAAGGGVAARKRAPTLPAKMLRRHRSGLVGLYTAPSSSAFPPVGLSSLVERARKRAAKSGPHAPPGRCCPASKQPQKKVTPRKQVKRAPPPAIRPRKPAQRPTPRPANARKQVAKRPAVSHYLRPHSPIG